MPLPGWNSVLLISTVAANTTMGNRVSYNELIDETMTIVRSCTRPHAAADALLLAGEYEEFFQRSLINDLPVALISQSKSTTFEYPVTQLFRKLGQFVVVASTLPLLRLLLQRTKNSGWSKFEGLHILVDRKTVERGCVNARGFLWAAWQYDRLAAIFLCVDPDEGIVLYTYNPYSSTAPAIWRNVGQFRGRGGHPWTLLRMKYQGGSRTCEGLTFDKAKDLNGYEIRMNAIDFEPHLRIDSTKTGLQRFSGDNSEILKIVFEKLNASVRVRVHTGTVYDLGGIDSHGSIVGMMADLATGEVDMGMNARSLHNTWKIEHTYPYGDGGLCVITRRAGELSEFVKILSFLSPSVHVIIGVLCTIALLVLAKHQGFLRSSVNIVHFMAFGSIYRLPRPSSSRIFFSSMFVLHVIFNALIQGHLASLLTIPVSLPNIRTAENLKRSGYQIYGSMFHERELQDPELRSRFYVNTYHGCKQRVLESDRAACLDDCLHQYARIQNDSVLHRSRKIQQNLLVYVTRENWPLLASVTRIIHRTVEVGIAMLWKKASTRKMYRARKRRWTNRKRKFRNLEIRHVLFSFYMLATGLFVATVTFAAEMIVGRR
ncbi:uncharacterized protein LOC122538127 isoform X1 [Frieseomelitta varia]|uniref:uncharacterized protein LOC122538127 isoform X1 n=1 Tax=Frieseomelitta varia TaxID=561572 RepID=UPI001CB69C6D|nr:uncharacterized protein LOC122538127 isoform X1 [Frieseomelitta varia]